MKISIIIILILGASIDLASADPQPLRYSSSTYTGKDLIIIDALSDIFFDNSIDNNKWYIFQSGDTYRPTWTFDPAAVEEANGKLKIDVFFSQHTSPYSGEQSYFKTGLARSKNKARYGYFEASIKGSSVNPGTGPSLWFFGSGNGITNEIDIVEMGLGHNLPSPDDRKFISSGIHIHNHPDPSEEYSDKAFSGVQHYDTSAGFHVYGVEWNAKELRFYRDWLLLGVVPNKHLHQDMAIRLSNSLRAPYVSGDTNSYTAQTPTSPSAAAAAGFPTTMEVEYFRGWKHQEAIRPPQYSTINIKSVARQKYVRVNASHPHNLTIADAIDTNDPSTEFEVIHGPSENTVYLRSVSTGKYLRSNSDGADATIYALDIMPSVNNEFYWAFAGGLRDNNDRLVSVHIAFRSIRNNRFISVNNNTSWSGFLQADVTNFTNDGNAFTWRFTQ